MNQVNKQHELTINISPQSRTNLITNTTFFSMDVKTGKKVINFTHNSAPLDLTNTTVLLGFEFVGSGTSKIIDSKDGSLMITNPEIGQCEVMLPNHFYAYTGQVLIHVYIMFEDGRSLDAGVIVTEFEESWLDQELDEMTDFYVRRFEDLAQEIRARVEVIRQELEREFDDVRTEIADAKREIREFVAEKGQAIVEAKGEIREFVAEKEQAMTEAKDEIRAFVTEKERVVAEGKSELRNFVDETKSELSIFKNEHKSSITSFITNAKESVDGFVAGVKEKVSQSIADTKNELSEFTQAQKMSIDETITEAKNSLSEFNTNLEAEVRALISELQNQVRDNIILQETEFANLSEEIRQRLREKLEDLNTAAELKRALKALMVEVQDQFEDDIENILRLASEIRAEMEANEASVHDFNEHIENEEIHMTPSERERWEGQFANLEDEIDTRAPMDHTHTAAQVGARAANWVPAWGDITGRPATFAPTIGTTATTAAAGNHTHAAQTTITGNAGTATTLATARNINGTSFNGSAAITTAQWGTARTVALSGAVTGSASVNGGANVTIATTQANLATTAPVAAGTAAVGTSALVARQDHRHPLQTTVTGNAGTATTLATARNINGTSFNGSAAITTANWGTARNITIGSTTRSVNGSGNVTWSLADIGAAPASAAMADSGWVNLPLASGATAISGAVPQYRRIGNMVYLRGGFTNILGSVTAMATLPSGFRPAGSSVWVTVGTAQAMLNNNVSHVRMEIATDGRIFLAQFGSGSVTQTRINTSFLNN